MTFHKNRYQSSFTARYASKEMSFLFSDRNRYETFRKLWLQLAVEQKKLGLKISSDQISQMKKHLKTIDFEQVCLFEKQTKHDVMAHIHAFAQDCPKAASVIHLGATSCFVTDNTDLIIFKKALELIRGKLYNFLKILSKLAKDHSNLACLGFTHLQPAQPTTLGKRICLWLQDFLIDYQENKKLLDFLPFLGIKGATGTQSSFLNLFEGNHTHVKKLDKRLAESFGFKKLLTISGQTYSRKIDVQLLNFLASFASSAHKFATDIRLLSHLGEITEKFEKKQVGSSAMPHKKNPIYSERICGLSRYLIALAQNPLYTHATQWFERSLDDSSNRRLCMPEAFLSADALLDLLTFISSSFHVDKKIVAHNLSKQIHSLACEAILMMEAKKGKDRQKLHEKLKRLIHQKKESFLEDIEKDPSFSLNKDQLKQAVTPSFLIGRSKEQILEFLKNEMTPVLEKDRSFSIKPSKIQF